MATKPFITIQTGNIKADVASVNAGLDQASDIALAATKQAIAEACEDMLAKAQARIHTLSGDLEASGTVLPVEIQNEEISGKWGFNKEYAHLRDQGGDILPKNGSMLAIPLDPILTAAGISRYSSPLEEANLELVPILDYLFLADKTTHEFHWILVPHVHQEGNQFVSGTVQDEAQNVAPRIADRVGAALAGGGAK